MVRSKPTQDELVARAVTDYRNGRITRGELGWRLMCCNMSQQAIDVCIRQQDIIIAATQEE